MASEAETNRETPQLPFLYGREQGGGLFTDALENLIADLRGLLSAANPGQQVVIQREHIDRDGFYFTARVLPYLTEAQFKAAAEPADSPSLQEVREAVMTEARMQLDVGFAARVGRVLDAAFSNQTQPDSQGSEEGR